jgi:hypothetical protein
MEVSETWSSLTSNNAQTITVHITCISTTRGFVFFDMLPHS